MRETTKNSIDKKMSSLEEPRYFVYKKFQSSGKSIGSAYEITKYTLNEYTWIKSVFNDLIKYNINPFEKFKDRERKIDEFVDHMSQHDYDSRVISDEKMIQRHLAKNSELYKDKLGKIIDFECNIPYEDKKASIDILSYKFDDNGALHFIVSELKRCSLDFTSNIKNDDPAFGKKHTNEAKDLLIRAIMEAALYGIYFKAALESEKKNLLSYLKTKICENLSDEQIVNASIDYYIIAPDSIVSQRTFDCFNDFDLSGFSFFSIEQSCDYKEIGYVGDIGKKYFDIEKVL